MGIISVVQTGLFTDDPDVISDCFWATSYISDTEDDEVISMIASGDIL